MTTEAGDPMGTTTTTYADAVRRALDDLPAARYLELVDGLDEHLAEVRAEADGTLADVLGPPEAYAAELRASAGLPPRAGAAATGAPLPPPTVPLAAPAPAPRRPIDRGFAARTALAVAGGLVVLWVLGIRELPTLKLALIVLGVLGATWVARRLLGAATLADHTTRRVSTAIAIGGLVVAAAVGSAASTRRIYVPYDNPPITMMPGQGAFAVPDFRGMTMAQANEVATGLGLNLQMIGGTYDRIVMSQDPAPGTPAVYGSQVVLSVTPEPAPSFSTTTTIAVLPAETSSAAPSPTTVAPSTTLALPTTVAPTTAGPSTSVAG